MYCILLFQIERDLKSKIQRMQEDSPQSYCVRFEKNRVIIAGETKKVDSLTEKFHEMIDTLEKRLDAMNKPITKVVTLERYKFDMYVKYRCDQHLKDVYSSVDDEQNIVLKVFLHFIILKV